MKIPYIRCISIGNKCQLHWLSSFSYRSNWFRIISPISQNNIIAKNVQTIIINVFTNSISIESWSDLREMDEKYIQIHFLKFQFFWSVYILSLMVYHSQISTTKKTAFFRENSAMKNVVNYVCHEHICHKLLRPPMENPSSGDRAAPVVDNERQLSPLATFSLSNFYSPYSTAAAFLGSVNLIRGNFFSMEWIQCFTDRNSPECKPSTIQRYNGTRKGNKNTQLIELEAL